VTFAILFFMKRAILYTGTFDPYHLGHLWQVERVYKAYPFDKVVVAIIRQNPKKPNASPWQDRLELARLALTSKPFPFEIEVRTIDYIEPEKLRDFVEEYLNDYEVSRTVASDSIREFAQDKSLHPQFSFKPQHPSKA
jgi:cytidyltransferase-like protein